MNIRVSSTKHTQNFKMCMFFSKKQYNNIWSSDRQIIPNKKRRHQNLGIALFLKSAAKLAYSLSSAVASAASPGSLAPT
jgi:hypothetical protein